MQTEFLDLELQLLVAKHGRTRLMQGLARLENVSPEQLEERIARLSDKTLSRKKVKRPFSAEEIIAQIEPVPASRRQELITMSREFEQGRFLPQLADALRFCAKHGQKVRARSRRDLLPKIVAVLAALREDELREIVGRAHDTAGGGGSFARLANAIMRGGED